MARRWDDYDDILTVNDIKSLLGIGTRSARKLAREHGIQIAGKYMISKAKIQRLFE